jgi:translation elongation factor EF-Tu-like GTPase
MTTAATNLVEDARGRVIYDITIGTHDEYLDDILWAVKQRKSAIAPKAWDFKPGDRVRYTDATRPLYLIGATGVVRQINRTKVVVDLDQPAGRFHKRVTTPTSLIEKIEEAS